jgi:hypothetical protein
MNKTIFATVALMVLAVAGCGSSQNDQETALTCDPAEAPIGAKVSCRAENVADDCTLFLVNTPVEFTVDAEQGTVSFVVPPTLPGQKDIKIQCGGGEAKDLGKFLVPPPSQENDAPVPGDDTIAPSGEGSPEGGTDSPGWTISQASPKIGKAVRQFQTVGNRLNVESLRDDPSVRFSTYKISFNVAGAPKALYLSGNLFNRAASDASADQPCGKVGEGTNARFLATQANGDKLNEGSAVYEQNAVYAVGEVCGEGEDCRHGLESEEENSWCRIDPTNAEGTPLAVGSFYTRSLVEHGVVCLAVQAQDDSWSTECHAVDARPATVTETDVDVSPDRPVVTMRVAYENAAEEPRLFGSGCHRTGGEELDHKGAGNIQAECPIDSDSKVFAVTVSGIGSRNNAGRFYSLELGTPVAGFRLGGAPSSNDKGEVGLFYDVSRPYTLKASDALLGGEATYSASKSSHCPWAKEIRFTGRYVVGGEKVTNPSQKIESAADASGRIAGDKDYDSVTWSYQALDFASHGVDSGGISAGFPFSFNLVGASGSWNYNYMYDECDGAFEDAKDECCQGSNCPHDSDNAGAHHCHNYRVRIQFGWAGENVSSVAMTCTPKGESKDSAFTVQLPLDQNTWESDRIGGEKVSCEFVATSKMGTILTANYTYHRGEGVCDGPDRGGNDHDDSGFDD